MLFEVSFGKSDFHLEIAAAFRAADNVSSFAFGQARDRLAVRAAAVNVRLALLPFSPLQPEEPGNLSADGKIRAVFTASLFVISRKTAEQIEKEDQQQYEIQN